MHHCHHVPIIAMQAVHSQLSGDFQDAENSVEEVVVGGGHAQEIVEVVDAVGLTPLILTLVEEQFGALVACEAFHKADSCCVSSDAPGQLASAKQVSSKIHQ